MKMFAALLSIALFFTQHLALAEEGQLENSPALSISVSNEDDVSIEYYYFYNFGTIQRGSSRSAFFSVTNNRSTPLTVVGFFVSGAQFNGSHNCPRTLEPGRFCQIEVRYWPFTDGWHRGRASLSFYEASDVVIDVEGRAVSR